MANYKNLLDKTLSLWTPVVLWALVIFMFSAMPTNPVSQIRLTDFIIKKSAHIIEYAIFTTFLYRALHACGINKKEAGICSVILAILYGASDEFHQSFTPGRDPKLRDVFFDTIGAISATYLLWNLLPKAPSSLKGLARKLQIL